MKFLAFSKIAAAVLAVCMLLSAAVLADDTGTGIAYPQTLKDTAVAYLQENYIAASNIEITMTDMSHIDDAYKSFMLGQNVTVYSPKHFTGTKTFKIMKMTINVSDPTQTRITVGKVKRGFVESIV